MNAINRPAGTPVDGGREDLRRTTVCLVSLLGLLTAACGDGATVATSPAADATTTASEAPAAAVMAPPPVGFPECQAEEFDFAGQGTLRGLGLHTATPVPPPDIDRPAMVWVTRDLLPRDFGPPGGPVEMTRMLCFEFADGTGGSGWPVDPEWRPP